MAIDDRTIRLLCDHIMDGFAELVRRATPESPLGRARARLGDRFYDVTSRALREQTIAGITEDAEKWLEAMRLTPHWAAAAWVANLYCKSIRDICREAGVDAPALPPGAS
jgi:hypothetical protein